MQIMGSKNEVTGVNIKIPWPWGVWDVREWVCKWLNHFSVHTCLLLFTGTTSISQVLGI